MSRYTTGELAKACGVSVRTVQYYDNRGILIPGQLTEGGRRLYDEHDLRKMKIICFLREMDFSIKDISTLMQEQEFEKVIAVLIDQQEKSLRQEIAERKARLDKLTQMQQEMKTVEMRSLDAIGDIALIMENKSKLKRIHTRMVLVGILMDIIEVSTIILWISTGIWWPFVIGLMCIIAAGIAATVYYEKNIQFICPECHNVFSPRSKKEHFFARHTFATRELTCPECRKKSFCIETARQGRAGQGQCPCTPTPES